MPTQESSQQPKKPPTGQPTAEPIQQPTRPPTQELIQTHVEIDWQDVYTVSGFEVGNERLDVSFEINYFLLKHFRASKLFRTTPILFCLIQRAKNSDLKECFQMV